MVQLKKFYDFHVSVPRLSLQLTLIAVACLMLVGGWKLIESIWWLLQVTGWVKIV